MLLMKLMYFLEIFRFLRLCNSLSRTAFGKAPSISRKRAEATLPARHADLILSVSRCIASVVVRPGLPPKWFAGSSCCDSVRKVIWLAITAVSTFHIVFNRAIGRYALGVS